MCQHWRASSCCFFLSLSRCFFLFFFLLYFHLVTQASYDALVNFIMYANDVKKTSRQKKTTVRKYGIHQLSRAELNTNRLPHGNMNISYKYEYIWVWWRNDAEKTTRVVINLWARCVFYLATGANAFASDLDARNKKGYIAFINLRK